MGNELFMLVGILIVLVTGWVNIKSSLLKLVDDRNFAIEFANKLDQLILSIQKREPDMELYNWLISNMDVMQANLRHFGVANRKEPFHNYIVKNYPYILNTIPQIIRDDAHPMDIQMCFDAITRYVGFLERIIKDIESSQSNPLIWAKEGTRYWIAFPLKILGWVGVFKDSLVKQIENHRLFKFISSLVTLIGLIGSIMTIILGWDQFVELLRKLLSI